METRVRQATEESRAPLECKDISEIRENAVNRVVSENRDSPVLKEEKVDTEAMGNKAPLVNKENWAGRAHSVYRENKAIAANRENSADKGNVDCKAHKVAAPWVNRGHSAGKVFLADKVAKVCRVRKAAVQWENKARLAGKVFSADKV